MTVSVKVGVADWKCWIVSTSLEVYGIGSSGQSGKGQVTLSQQPNRDTFRGRSGCDPL